MRQTRYLAAGGVLVNDTLAGPAHNLGLGGFQRSDCGRLVAGGDRFLHLSGKGPHAALAGVINGSALFDGAHALLGRGNIGHSSLWIMAGKPGF